MALFGDIIILKKELISCSFNDEYNIITGYRSSQFLGRKARSATLRLSFLGSNAKRRVGDWERTANAGSSRGLILVGSELEGIFGIQKISSLVRQEINGVITRMDIEVQLVEDASQKVI